MPLVEIKKLKGGAIQSNTVTNTQPKFSYWRNIVSI